MDIQNNSVVENVEEKVDNIPLNMTLINKAVDAVKSKDTSISFKMRNLFYLRSLQSPEASLAIQKCLSYDSVLLDHEVAYVLGQMKQENSIEFLFSVADNKEVHSIVRHEAIEALGNFEDRALVSRIRKYEGDADPIIRESAILALRKLSDEAPENEKIGRFGSRDPAYPFRGQFEEAVELLRNGELVDKYRAIFYFRDLNNKEAVEALARGFEDPSDLLRHEVAYVFGQMQNEHATEALIKVLENPEEVEIVRHEAAEALGNIGTEKCENILKSYLNSEIRILKESAQVGLGISAYADCLDDGYLDV